MKVPLIQAFMNWLLPERDLRNITVSYVVQAAINSWFSSAIWLFFFRDSSTDTQIGLFFVIGLSALISFEIPSGVLSDKIGHRKVLLIAALLMVLGNGIITLNSSFLVLSIGAVPLFLGLSFYSGALDAFAYESLKEVGRQDRYEAFLAAKTRIGILFLASAILIGSLVFMWQRRGPYLLQTLSHTVTFACILFLSHEPQRDQQETVDSTPSWFDSLRKNVFTRKWLPLFFLAVVAQPIGALVGWGSFEISLGESAGLKENTLFLVMTPILLVRAYAVGQFNLVAARFSDPIVGSYCAALGITGCFFLISLDTVASFVVGVVLIKTLTDFLDMFMLSYVQEAVSSQVRASLLSVVSLVRWGVVMIGAFISGIAADNDWTQQMSFYFGAAVGICILLQGSLAYLTKGKQDPALKQT